LIALEQHKRNFLGVWMVCFFEFLTPSTLGGRNFLDYILFLTIFNVPHVPIGGVQILFGHHKQQNSPLGSSLPLAHKWLITDQFTL
jgi:hypothetical protein